MSKQDNLESEKKDTAKPHNDTKDKAGFGATSKLAPSPKNLLYAIILFVFLVLIGINFFWIHKENNIQKESIENIGLSVQSKLDSLSAGLTNVERGNQVDHTESQELKVRITELESKVANQGSRIVQMGVNPRNEWMLAEALYMSRLASQRLIIERSAQNALTLLLETDKLLARFNDPKLNFVREALSQEITSLRLLDKVDHSGIIFELNSLANEIEKLKIVELTGSPRSSHDKLSNSDSNSGNDDQLGINRIGNLISEKFANIVRIRRFDTTIQPIISSEDMQLMRQSIQLQFQQAIYAVIREEQELFQSNLDRISIHLNKYFQMNDSAGKFINRLNDLSNLRIKQQLPQIGRASELLNSYLNQRNDELLNTDLYQPKDPSKVGE